MDPQIREDLSWWLDYLILHNGHSWQITHWDLVVKLHALTQSWGASCEGTSRGAMDKGGKGSPHKLPGVASCLSGPDDIYSRSLGEFNPPTLRQVTALAYLNKMRGGSHSSLLSKLAFEI